PGAIDHDRACRTLPALSQGAAVFRISHLAQAMPRVRARLFLRRRRRRAGDLRDPDLRLHRGRRRADYRGDLPAAVLAACGAVGAADPRGDAAAAAPDQGPADRAAISSRRGRRPARARTEAVRAPGETAPQRRGLLVPAILLIGALAVLVGLGTWQLERREWKEALIAELDRKLAAPPADLPARERWQQLNAAIDEFRRVTFPAEFLPGEEALVYTSGSPLRPDVTGPGYWVFSPARLTGGSIVLVNRGFVPEGRQDAKTRSEGQPSGVVDIVGAMRWPEARGTFTPADQPDKNLWFARDPAAMAVAKGWGE